MCCCLATKCCQTSASPPPRLKWEYKVGEENEAKPHIADGGALCLLGAEDSYLLQAIVFRVVETQPCVRSYSGVSHQKTQVQIIFNTESF